MKSKQLGHPFFSIVIPTLNEEKYLPLLLKDLAKQTNQDFEVIHVDGNSEDLTRELAQKFRHKINISTHTTNVRNVSFQRNFGAKKSIGKWVLFMDADNRLPSFFLDGIKYQLAKNKDVDVFTTWVDIEGYKSLNLPIKRTLNLALELFKSIGKEWSLGALIGIKKKLAKKYKFDEKQKVAEDAIFIKLLVNNGYIFEIFREPMYYYSIRRLQTEGTLKVARSSTRMALNFIQGKDFQDDDFNYKMEGGSSYQIKNNSTLSYIQEYISSASIQQLKQAQKLLRNLRRWGI